VEAEKKDGDESKWAYTPRSIEVLSSCLIPNIALNNAIKAAFTSLLLTPLLLQTNRANPTTNNRKEISRHNLLTIIALGDLFSFLVRKNFANTLNLWRAVDRGLSTSDHIPISSISHRGDGCCCCGGWAYLPVLGLARPPTPPQDPDPVGTLVIPGTELGPATEEMFTEASIFSNLSVSAAKWA